MARRLGLIAGALLVIIVLVVGGAFAWLAWFPDTLKPPLERMLSARLGQQVRIEGPLRIDPGLVTTVDVSGLRIAAPGGPADYLLAVDRLRIGADLWDYVRHGTINVTEFMAEAPRVALERDAQERTSWPSGGSTDGGGGIPKVKLGRVEITDGQLDFADAVNQVEIATKVATSAQAGRIGLQLDGNGKIKADPLKFRLQMGDLGRVAQGEAPLPIDGSLELAASRVELKGEIEDPAALKRIDLALQVASDDPRGLLALAGRNPTGDVPPLSGSSRLTGGGRQFVVEDLRARWGDSSLDKRLRIDLAQAKPRFEGFVNALVVDVATLLPLLAPSDAPPAAAPQEGNPLQALAACEGTFELAAKEIRLPSRLVVRDAGAKLELGGDRLRATQLRVGLPEGAVQGQLVAGPLSAPELKVETQLQAADVGVAGVAGDGYSGRVNGRLDGTMVIGPIAAMLAHSRLRFDGKGDDLAIPLAKLGSLKIGARLENGRVAFDTLQASLPQGEVAGRVEAGPFDEHFTADLDLDATDVDLGALARIDGVAGQVQPLDLLTRSRMELKGRIDGLRLPQVERRVSEAEIVPTLDPDRREALTLVAEAKAGDRALQISAFGGSFPTLSVNRGDYPFTVVADLGKNDIKVNGTVSMPLSDRNFAATISAEGPDPSPILALLELPKLQIPPYRMKGVFTNRDQELQIKDFDGRVGDSDVAADLIITFDGARPKIAGKLTSKVLDADDLGGLVGATPASGPGEMASPGQTTEAKQIGADTTLLPDEPLDPTRWRKIDVDLDLRADKVQAGKVPLDGFTGHLDIADGLLRLEQLDLRVGEGHVLGRIEADGSKSPVRADVELDARRVSMARLLNRLDLDVAAFGTLSGRARGGVGLGGQGSSIKDILANSKGKVQLLMEGGQINRLIVAGLGLDLLRLFGAAVGATPETVDLNCVLADLDIGDGLIRTDPLVIDTAIADLGGRGTINLEDEAIDISLTARPKETPLLTDLTGISIGGKLGAPELNINPLAVAARGVTAATLGVLLKPFTNLAEAVGGQDASACTNLLRAPPGDRG